MGGVVVLDQRVSGGLSQQQELTASYLPPATNLPALAR